MTVPPVALNVTLGATVSPRELIPEVLSCLVPPVISENDAGRMVTDRDGSYDSTLTDIDDGEIARTFTGTRHIGQVGSPAVGAYVWGAPELSAQGKQDQESNSSRQMPSAPENTESAPRAARAEIRSVKHGSSGTQKVDG